MATLKLGVCVNPTDNPGDFAELVKQVEKDGFDYLWISDIALLARDAIAYLALAGAHTSTIKLGPCAFHPFVRHPAYSANAIATVDLISQGRCVLGMATGGREIIQEMVLEPANMTGFRDWVRLTRELLNGETVTYEGERYSLRGARLRFAGRKNIPIYIAATGPKMLSLSGEIGDGVFAMVGVDRACVEFAAKQVSAGVATARKGPESVDSGVFTYCAVSKSREEALNACRRGAGVIVMLNRAYAELAGVPGSVVEAITHAAKRHGTLTREFGEAVPDEVAMRFALAGTPEDCRRTLEVIKQTGVGRVDIYPQGPSWRETIRLFATEVLPNFRG
jgi:5,10-methylenetetrahydromethanopterin reductase